MGASKSKSDSAGLAHPKAFCALRIHDGEVASVVHPVIWDEQIRSWKNQTADTIPGKSLNEIFGTEAVFLTTLLSLAPSDAPRTARLHLTEGRQHELDIVVYVPPEETAACSRVCNYTLWLIPVYQLALEKSLCRVSVTKGTPTIEVCGCQRCLVEGAKFANRVEVVKALTRGGATLFHNVIPWRCARCASQRKPASPPRDADDRRQPNTPLFRSRRESRQTPVCVLLESDAKVLASWTEVLTTMGLLVVPFGDARAAVEHLASGLRTDLVIAEYVMPGVSGSHVVQTICRVSPESTVIAIAGAYAFAEVAIEDGACAFVLRSASALEIKRQIYETASNLFQKS